MALIELAAGRYRSAVTLIAVGRLVLVRHAMPEVDPAVPAERWRLGPEGRTAARALAPLVATPAYFVASDEPRAAETLREVAGRLAVATDSGFREVQRPHVWSSNGDYRALALNLDRTPQAGTMPGPCTPTQLLS